MCGGPGCCLCEHFDEDDSIVDLKTGSVYCACNVNGLNKYVQIDYVPFLCSDFIDSQAE